jgi:hypothetical protein
MHPLLPVGGAVGGLSIFLLPTQIQPIQEPCMDAPATVTKPEDPQPVRYEDRNTWIFTVYVICGIALFGVLAYYASLYFAHK